ncbi:dTMP kinase [Alkalilimnicola sp. S0819]|uniref:dTMP kinase n=1 Tax=Alkalilimnicola sp. S0819 TaxID=2613922 RepID=UPI001261D8E1|nr:dTMP kinase [Alkalilimnicola sp. S0819]KAB7627612.1 dTMP kinase [Alkalilimnicola sp. S0819]MPQ15774.1 dTMP kinase [Alkalilimnicola sp. S0819]
MRRGRFITLEGLEGAGKTSCLGFVRQQLAAHGIAPLETREPGGTPLGEAVRELLLAETYTGMAAEAEALLMFAARAEHLDKCIRPALAQGRWVLCDRFTEASLAYQGGGRGLGRERVAALEQWLQGELRPDLTLLLDVPVEQGLARAAKRGALDRFEQERLDFFERAREVYLTLARDYPQRIRLIDASRPQEQVLAQLGVELGDFLERALDE